jgi:hypothetical protein
MTRYVVTDADKLSKLAKMARGHAFITHDTDCEAVLDYFDEQLENARQATDQEPRLPFDEFDAKEDTIDLVQILAEEVTWLITKVNEIGIDMSDHDREISDLLRTTFCSYDRQRDRRRWGNDKKADDSKPNSAIAI